jgi:quercetin dioxygenase-like cupin family protein
MSYTSKDFGRTKGEMRAELPEKLLHPDVAGTGLDTQFSQERKHLVQVVDLPSKTISVTLGGLEPAQSTNRHRHSYETILYVLEGEGETLIEDRLVEWKAGDAVYIPVWAWHSHRNRSEYRPCKYLACENAPLMQNLGAAVREEP